MAKKTGWRNEPARHSLAARGVKTAQKPVVWRPSMVQSYDTYKPMKFTGDWNCLDDKKDSHSEYYSGYTNGELWNGWQVPWFTRESVVKYAKNHPEQHWILEEGVGVWTYDEWYDGSKPSGPPKHGVDDLDDVGGGYTGWSFWKASKITVNGKEITAYPVGSGSWCWVDYDKEW